MTIRRVKTKPSGDRRSVSTDALDTLGTIIDDTAGRDAIHLAVEPVIAGGILLPGEHVGITNGVAVRNHPRPVGIVDPFLSTRVEKGERFWLVVYPRKITSLRHVWSHPDFPEEVTFRSKPRLGVEASERWLRKFCNTSGPGYEAIMAVLMGQIPDTEDDYSGFIDGEYFHFNGTDASGHIPPEFWTHAEIVTGRTFYDHPSRFSCSC